MTEQGCPVCRGGGWVLNPETGRAVRCDCMAEQDRLEREKIYLKLCHLPAATEELTFETFQVTAPLREAYDAALELAEGTGRLKWLTLVGGVDRGKTHLAIAVCHRWLKRGRAARYAFVPLLLDELRRAYQPDAPMSYDAEFHFFLNVPLLVLDDLGAESSTPWAQEKLDTIVDYRYINKLPLVVTTNLPLDRLSPRIASRLQRFELGRVIALDAPEYRLRRLSGGSNG